MKKFPMPSILGNTHPGCYYGPEGEYGIVPICAVLSTWFWDLMVVLVFNLKSAGLLKLQKIG